MTAEQITLRLATTRDAETIAAISRKTFYDTFAEFNTAEDIRIFLNEQFTKESLIKEVGVRYNTFFLAYQGHDVAGYVKLRDHLIPRELKGEQAMEIARIYATHEMIGKGVGKKLMQHSIEVSKQRNKQVIWLAVWEKNERAMEFYTKWGFEIFSKQIFILGTDLQKDWLMKKRL
ncbi:MAG: GNAT family N-acetyltransferase [Chitinophagaceae bacterium]